MPALTQIELASPPDRSETRFAPEFAIHSGRAAVLVLAPQLEALAGQSGQPGAMHGFGYVIDHEYAARKLPHVLLLFAPDGTKPQRLIGAVVLFEYRVGAWQTGIITTGDNFGVRTVIGAEPLRASIAVAACNWMLARHARIVLASFKCPCYIPKFFLTANSQAVPALWALETRFVQDHLPLAETYEETLARMGKRTRTHLRYYRRRLLESAPCEFVEDATSWIDPKDETVLAHLNRSSLGPIAQSVFNLQYRSTALPGGFVCGLRTKDGHWLSLAGGWRQGDTTWVQWQMNASGFESFSLSTVLRSFLIEAEVARGARKLAFHGGTSHSMGHAFAVEQVVDLVARRPGFSAAVVARILPRLYARLPSLRSRGNFLADALRSGSLHWHSTASLPEEFRRRVSSSSPATSE